MIWHEFFKTGGLGMYPIAVDGFLLVAAALLLVLRPERRFVAPVICLGLLTLSAGVLGTTVGLVNVLHYVTRIPSAHPIETVLMGSAEALHCLVFALLFVTAALFMSSIAALRGSRSRATG